MVSGVAVGYLTAARGLVKGIPLQFSVGDIYIS
jgi:hypothetical protein